MEREDRVQARLEAIEELIKTQAIEDQETLTTLLKKHHNIEVNQSIISKDLRKLGIGKQLVGNKMVYELPATDPTREILRQAIISVEHNESLIVIKTVPGLAAFVGDYIDSHTHIGILGTIAGENTVFVAPFSTQQIVSLYNDLRTLLHLKT